jgi:16S rRNA (guanine966-N2)-methyltransferase
VTGGDLKGFQLAESGGSRLRPTSARVREAIFNVLAARVEEAAVLDLFAGTGALGIEALSRGANRAVFVESHRPAARAIVQSLARAGLSGRGSVVRGALPAALDSIDGPFDLVFLDPPYDSDQALPTLSQVAPLLAADGLVVYEHRSRYNPPERPLGLTLTDRRVYGDTAVAFFVTLEGA